MRGRKKWVPAGVKNGIMNNICAAAAFLQFKFSFFSLPFSFSSVNNFVFRVFLFSFPRAQVQTKKDVCDFRGNKKLKTKAFETHNMTLIEKHKSGEKWNEKR